MQNPTANGSQSNRWSLIGVGDVLRFENVVTVCGNEMTTQSCFGREGTVILWKGRSPSDLLCLRIDLRLPGFVGHRSIHLLDEFKNVPRCVFECLQIIGKSRSGLDEVESAVEVLFQREQTSVGVLEQLDRE